MSISRFIDELERAPSGETRGRLPSQETASCAEAWRYETSTAKRNAAYCSRRAGKTLTGRRRASRVLVTPAEDRHERWVHLVSLIRRNAKKHWWTGIKALLQSLGWHRTKVWEQDMILRLESGGFLQCLGVDDEADVKRLQGDYSDLIIGDEAHLPNDHVQRAFFAAATPMLIDYGGAFDWLGLPPDVEPTAFSEAIDNPEWSSFHWDLLDHDYPRPRAEKLAEIEADLKARGLTWDSPEAQRSYRGKRVRDPSKTAYEYQAGRNDYDPRTVDFGRRGWLHVVGQDQGWSDKDALAVLAWRPDDPDQRAYVRFVWNRNHVATSTLRKLTAAVQDAYSPARWVADHSGGGSQRSVADISEHLGIALERKPTDVAASLGLMNDDLRTGRLLFPTVDVETARVDKALRARFRNDELDEMLLALREGAVHADLTRLVASVSKLYDPVTRKLKINTQAKHVDISEAIRYAHSALKNHLAAAVPVTRKLTVEEREEADDERDLEESDRERGMTWYQRQAAGARRRTA